MSMKMIWNTKSFDREFGKLVKTAIPALVEKGLFEALALLKSDADNVVPKTPKDKGDLKGTYKIKVRKTFKGYEGILHFEMPYASRLHEAPPGWNWTLSGSGPKYLQSKADRFKFKYNKKIADRIRGGK